MFVPDQPRLSTCAAEMAATEWAVGGVSNRACTRQVGICPVHEPGLVFGPVAGGVSCGTPAPPQAPHGAPLCSGPASLGRPARLPPRRTRSISLGGQCRWRCTKTRSTRRSSGPTSTSLTAACRPSERLEARRDRNGHRELPPLYIPVGAAWISCSAPPSGEDGAARATTGPLRFRSETPERGPGSCIEPQVLSVLCGSPGVTQSLQPFIGLRQPGCMLVGALRTPTQLIPSRHG